MKAAKVILIFVFLLSTQVWGNTSAKIEKILIFEQGNLIYIYPEGGVNNPPACHGSNGDYLSYKMDRPMAKEYLSMLMLAFATQKTVNFRTAGDCIDQPISETINYFTVLQ